MKNQTFIHFPLQKHISYKLGSTKINVNNSIKGEKKEGVVFFKPQN